MNAMRAADEPRVCQICGETLHGRGRSKWCAIHSELVHKEQNKARAAQWQRDWRARHAVTYKNQKWIYRMADKVECQMLDAFPKAPAILNWERVHENALADIKEAFKEVAGVCHEGEAKARPRAI